MLITPFNTPDFLFYLINGKGESYYIDGAGELQRSGIPRPLDYSPDGWTDLSLGWERNFLRFGLVRSFSISLGFLGDGFRILEKLWNAKNIDEPLFLLVQKKELELEPYLDPASPGTFDFVHRFYYKGEIDLSSYRRRRRRVVVNIMEGGRVKELAADEGTTMAFPMDAPETIRVKFDGIRFQNRGNYNLGQGLALSNKDTSYWFVFPTTLLDTEGTPTGISFVETFLEPVPAIVSYMAGSNNYMATNSTSATPVAVRAEGLLRIKCTKNQVGGSFGLGFYKQGSAVALGGAGSPIMTAGTIYEIPVNVLLNVNKDDKIFPIATFGSVSNPSAIELGIEILEGSRLSLSYTNAAAPSMVRFYKPMDLFRRFVEKISGDAALAVSSLLESSGICFTSGDALRGLPKAELKETFQNFALFWRCLKCAGVGVEMEKIVLERFAHFFRTDEEVDLGEAKDLEIEVATELYFSSLKAGYLDQNYDDLNGRFEPNSTQEFSAPQKRIAKKLELVAPIRGDFYGAEYTRINYGGKTTTDSDSDNDTFAVLIDLATPLQDAEGTYYKPKVAAYTTITGIPDPGIGNIEEMTPHRCLAEWYPYFRGVFWKYEGRVIKFESGLKNTALETTGGPGGTFRESADLPVLNGAAPAFLPFLMKCDVGARVNLAKILRDKPWTTFRFRYGGVTFRGFLLKGAIKSRTFQTQTFTFLATPNNNPKLLENG